MLADIVDHVIGIDPDRDQITASLVEASTGGELATEAFETTRGGYESCLPARAIRPARASQIRAVNGIPATCEPTHEAVHSSILAAPYDISIT